MCNILEERIKSNHYAIFFCLAITLHNIEEAIWLPEWSQSAFSIQQPVTTHEFHFAVIVITALAYLATFFFVQFPHINMAKYAFIGFLGAMVLNTFFPHLFSTIIMKAYAPGLITGLLLNVPINLFILYQLHKQHIINFKNIFISTLVVGGILLILIPVLFNSATILLNY